MHSNGASSGRLTRRFAAWLIAIGIGSYVYMPICDLHFDCGCGWPGLGVGHAHCDILQAGLPDCPWCLHEWLGYTVMALSSALGLLGTLFSPPRWSTAGVTLLATGTVLTGLLVTGIVTSLWLDLPILAGL